jgi:hypothetical protein
MAILSHGAGSFEPAPSPVEETMKKVWCRALRPMYFSGRRVKRGMKFSIPKMEAERLLQETSNFVGAFRILGTVEDKPKPTARTAKSATKTSAKPRKRKTTRKKKK